MVDLENRVNNEDEGTTLTKRQLRKKEKRLAKLKRKQEKLNKLGKNNINSSNLDDNLELKDDEKKQNNQEDINNNSSIDSISEPTEKEFKDESINNKLNIKDHVLYLTPDNLVDIYLHSTVGTDERVYLSHALLNKYGISNPEVHFINVNGVNIPVDKFNGISLKDPEYVLANYHIPKNDSEKLEELKNLTEEEDSSKEISEVDKLAKDKPISPILDDDSSLETEYNHANLIDKKSELVSPYINKETKQPEVDTQIDTGNGYNSLPKSYISGNENNNDLGEDYYYVKDRLINDKREDKSIVNNSASNFINTIEDPNAFIDKNSILVSPYLESKKVSANNSPKIANTQPNINKLNDSYLDGNKDDNFLGHDYYYLKDNVSSHNMLPDNLKNSEVKNYINTMEDPSYFNNKTSILNSPDSSNDLHDDNPVLVSPYIENHEKDSAVKESINTGHGYNSLPDAYFAKNDNSLLDQYNKQNTPINSSESKIEDVETPTTKEPILVSPYIASDKNNNIIKNKTSIDTGHGYSFLPEEYLRSNNDNNILGKEYYYSKVQKSEPSQSSVEDNFCSKEAILVSPYISSNKNNNIIKNKVSNDTGHGYSFLPEEYLRSNNDNNMLGKEYYYSKVQQSETSQPKLQENFYSKEAILVSPNHTSTIIDKKPVNKSYRYNTGSGYYDVPTQYFVIENINDNSNNSNYLGKDVKPNIDINQIDNIGFDYVNRNLDKKMSLTNNNDIITLNKTQTIDIGKYLVDPKRKIYIIEEEDAYKLFNINPSSLSNKKVLYEGNVLTIFNDSENSFLTAPYKVLENRYDNPNIFLLPYGFIIYVYKNILNTSLIVNNFEVNVENVSFLVPKNLNDKLSNANLDNFPYFLNPEMKSTSIDLKNNLNQIFNDKDINLLNNGRLNFNNLQQDLINNNEFNINNINEKINIISVFNILYKAFLNQERRINRRINHLYKMIRQILFDSSYYVENRLLLMNYPEMLIFLIDYFNLNINNIYDAATVNNPLLINVLEDVIQRNKDSIPESYVHGNNSYSIPERYYYVSYKDKLFEINDLNELDLQNIDEVLLNRPEFSEDEFNDFSQDNYERLRAISPYIDFVNFYKNYVSKNYPKQDESSLNKLEKTNEENKVVTDQGNTLYLTRKEFEELTGESTILNSSVFTFKENATKYGLNNPRIKYVNVDGTILTLYRASKHLNHRQQDIIYLPTDQFKDLYDNSKVSGSALLLNERAGTKYGLNNPNIRFVNAEGNIVSLERDEKSNKLRSDTVYLTESQFKDLYDNSKVSGSALIINDQNALKYGFDDPFVKYADVNDYVMSVDKDDGNSHNPIDLGNKDIIKENNDPLNQVILEQPNFLDSKQQIQEVINSNEPVEPINSNVEDNKVNNDESPDLSKKEEKLNSKDDNTLVLSEQDLKNIYKHSRITEDGVVYLNQKLANKLGLNNKNIKYANINGEVIPINEITKSEMNKQLSKEQEFIPIKDSKKKKEKLNQNRKRKINNILPVDEDGIAHLTQSQMNDLYIESKVGNDDKAYISEKIANKYGLLDPKIKQIEVNGTKISLEQLKRNDFKKMKKRK